MRYTVQMGCGVMELSGFGSMYPSHMEELSGYVSQASKENRLLCCTIPDRYLKDQPKLVDALRKHGFEQVHRWENRLHPDRDGGSMCNLFILRPPAVQVATNHKDPAKYNWMDKRRKSGRKS